MADDNQAPIAPETATQDTPMPSVDQQTTPSSVAPVDAPQEETISADDKGGLPEEASDRTKREFDKLQQQLREERARREYAEQVYASMTPKTSEREQVPIYDPDTGLIDPDQLSDLQRQTIEANNRAQNAEKAVQSYLTDQENRETFAAHPELDPNGQAFSKELHVETRRIMLDSMLNPDDYSGTQLSFKQAADLAKKSVGVEQAKQEGAQEAIEQLTSKEQASLSATGTSGRSRSLDGEDLAQLQRRTRSGDKDAIVERFRRLNSQK